MRPFLKAVIILLLFAASPTGAFAGRKPEGPILGPAQGYAPGSVVRFEHLTIEDGLSQNAGLAVFQDSRGYLWIGTQDGLNRYDGYAITVFKNDPDDPASLSYNAVLAFAEDAQGYLWIGTWGGGLNRFDPASETFTRYLHDDKKPGSLSGDIVTALHVDSRGRLWVGTTTGLNLLDEASGTFTRYRNDPKDLKSLSSDVIGSLLEDQQGSLWVGTGALGIQGAGLNRLDPATGSVQRFTSAEGNLPADNVSTLAQAPDGMVWIGTGGYSLEGRGLFALDPASGQFTRYANEAQNEESLSSDSIMSVWCDANGVLWIGTWSSGLNRMELS
ncbi:MAG TPA: two-component regulator propeller domain-containing protein, partial [Anaerolineales bacterium]